jgi:hypothetical protein
MDDGPYDKPLDRRYALRHQVVSEAAAMPKAAQAQSFAIPQPDSGVGYVVSASENRGQPRKLLLDQVGGGFVKQGAGREAGLKGP